MHGFSHQYSIVRRNATKPIVSGESVKLVLILFAQYECFFLMWFQFHGIPHHMRNGQVSPSVPHSTGKCNKTYFMGLTWEIGTRTFPVVCLLNFSHEIPIIWYTSWDYHIGNAWVSSWISIPSVKSVNWLTLLFTKVVISENKVLIISVSGELS